MRIKNKKHLLLTKGKQQALYLCIAIQIRIIIHGVVVAAGGHDLTKMDPALNLHILYLSMEQFFYFNGMLHIF